jgi:hypothetical protein
MNRTEETIVRNIREFRQEIELSIQFAQMQVPMGDPLLPHILWHSFNRYLKGYSLDWLIGDIEETLLPALFNSPYRYYYQDVFTLLTVLKRMQPGPIWGCSLCH